MTMPQEPELGPEPLPPPTEEEQEAEAWEYWHREAVRLQHRCDMYIASMAIMHEERDRRLELLAEAARQLAVGGVNTKDAIALIVRIEEELRK